MFQVTAIYDGAEIGYGEAEAYANAAREAADSVPDVYPAADVILECSHGCLTVATPLDMWRALAN